MKQFLAVAISLSFWSGVGLAQTAPMKDSVTVSVHASYNNVSGVHRWLFGENYRKEWALPVKLSLIRLSQFNGGLTPLKQGGGMQSKSLRLQDKKGREWVLRSVEKVPDKLLPEGLQNTFAVDWFDDEFSGQHPYSALVVPPLAAAVGVPHANPVIGVVADDPNLGEYQKMFVGLVCLVEEREPTGESDNTIKMQKDLVKNYDNRFNAELFLKARLLDLLIGDWDRHEDQWRWTPNKKGKDKMYDPVPRDRDQVFHLTEGLFPKIAAQPFISPLLDDFEGEIPRVKFSLAKTRFMGAMPDAQMSIEDWMRITNEFVKAETDAVLEAGLKRLPKETYQLRHDELFRKLKQRRDAIPAAMAEYYRFVNRIVDIRTTDKAEKVSIVGEPNKALRISIQKINADGQERGELMNMTYQPYVTEELRIYLQGGKDRVTISNATSPIKIRIIDSAGAKSFFVDNSINKIDVYGQKDSVKVTGDLKHKIRQHLSKDTLNGRFVPVNLYNVWMPLATGGINADDGLLIGLGAKYIGRDGFRKVPYTTVQQLLITHAFATDAFRIKYNGEWTELIGKADITAQAFLQAPDNTVNFFGRGNETSLDKFPGYRRYHRTRFDTYQFDLALRWRVADRCRLSIGPSLQLYHAGPEDNAGRFLNQTALINAYDATSVYNNKAHAGLLINYISDHRDNTILPRSGYALSANIVAYTGLNSYSKDFAQIRPEFTFYQPIGDGKRLTLSDRIGGGVSIGNPAFYQSMFLGGQGNLLGYLQNRFSGDHMVYNNFQARLKLANIASYILPGQLGLTGFYDVGRVWVNGEQSSKFHHGTGGGAYFSPAGLAVVQVLAGHSTEGWYPYVSLNVRL
ncbi:BamA/TamA family outer membrane protein [Mucilaginibacter myungsuensis]|uniref:BamA/TamA family outer membrane protein n=1 Tax=Mucilaginibacter myungsuensis TaxID=649104 RepID=A0A929KU26_9SPHI|nr:BamA/TamA family outer membrane protein [Mucilaginibacter myungsuensis]MBE9660430.1 BamA/TamA family outer membrane protein [Mucilaginibacter myungsuensis]MDN3600472.1 BamA/TamA family outer membrane protein [Mucilaginibacter myungsuensis]